MKEFLSQHAILFEEHLVDKDPKALDALVEKIGRWATPTLLVGDEVVIGFDREKVSSLLGINQ